MLNESLNGTCHEDNSRRQEYAPNMRGARSNTYPGMRNMPPQEGNSRAVGSTYGRPPAGGSQGGQQNPRTRGMGNGPEDYSAWSSKPPPNSRPNGAAPGNGRGQNMSRPMQGNSYDRGDDFASRPEGGQSPQQARAKAKQAPANRRRQQENRKDNSETRDTVIGIGFTAAMKRGVAQAKPTLAREELQQQKDGGFIATIQRGFEGLFGGKPTSKEEVLRQRGPVFANEYEAVPGDEIDQKVQYFARRLSEDVAGCLKIFRARKGEYQINDEIVNMEQKYRQAPNGQTEMEIFVFWQTDHGDQSDPEPLHLYLSHTANVAFEVKQGGNAITQVPDHARMSFRDEIGTKLTDGSADARFNAMEVAARQAKMREEAAVEWREKQNNPNRGKEFADSPSQSPRAQQQDKHRAEAEVSIVDQALQAMGIMQSPQPPPQSYAAPAAAPTPTAYVTPAPQGMNIPVGAPALMREAGYMVPQPQAMLRPSTASMYSYGSAAPMASVASYPQMPGMPQGGLRPSYASMYSTTSAYGGNYVPVR